MQKKAPISLQAAATPTTGDIKHIKKNAWSTPLSASLQTMRKKPSD